MNFFCRALVFSLLYKLSVEGAVVKIYLGNSADACNDPTNLLGSLTAFNDVCTANTGQAATLSSCSDSKASFVVYSESGEKVIYNAPKCGKGNATSYAVSKNQCTLIQKECFFTADCYGILVDSTCTAPSSTYLASFDSSTCASNPTQNFLTIFADNTCKDYTPFFFSPVSYISSVGSSSDSINFKLFLGIGCNISQADASWTNVPTTGSCVDASPKKDYASIKISKPLPFLLSSTIAAIILGIIIGPIIGSIVCCCVCWGALHACGVVNCPCFNRCCDRRKNIASSNSNSFPSTAYATQAPRSSPYGNARL